MKNVYLDYAAATPIDTAVQAAMEPYFSRQFHNPSALYLAGRAAHQALEQARSSVAKSLGTKPAEITFTAGATEANNLAIQGVMKNYPDGEVLVSSIEHESVLAPAKLFKHKLIPVNSQGIVDLAALRKMINSRTALVSVGLVNNEIGTIQPLAEIAKILNQSSILLHSDAAQAPNYLDLSPSRLGVDLLSLNGGKIYGPKQSGALFIKAGTKVQPLILGGGQESGLRSGTENLAAAAGLAKAIEISVQKRDSESRRVTSLKKLFMAELEKLDVASINGSTKHSAPHIVNVSFAGMDNERLMMELDERGFQVATGSACSAANQEPSHVLKAIGLSDQTAGSSLRFSFGRPTSEADIMQVLKQLGKLTS